MSEVGWILVDAQEAGNGDTLHVEQTILASLIFPLALPVSFITAENL